MLKENYILLIKTVQSSVIKTLFEVIKDVLLETNIVVTPNSMKISSLDNQKMSIVLVNLDADKFEEFYCDTPKIVMGINTSNFFTIVKNLKNDDIVTFFIEKKDTTKMGISFENSKTSCKSTFKFDLQDIPNIEFNESKMKFDAEISTLSADFKKYCSMFNNLHVKTMEIQSVGQQLMLIGVGSHTSAVVTLGESKDTKITDNDDADIIQGVFRLEFLILFSKAVNLSTTVKFCLSNHSPTVLLMSYDVGSLGILRFIVKGSNCETS